MLRQSLNVRLSFPFFFFPQQQIVEEVQKFYSTSIADVSAANSTAIALIYHKVVSEAQLDDHLCVICVKATIADFLFLIFFLSRSLSGNVDADS